jgi:hypothetical protein
VEAAAARERAKTLIKEAEARGTLAEREAQERVLKVKAERAASLAFVHMEANESARKVALLECELVDACQAWDMAEANFQGLSDREADANQRRDDAERQCQDLH